MVFRSGTGKKVSVFIGLRASAEIRILTETERPRAFGEADTDRLGLYSPSD